MYFGQALQCTGGPHLAALLCFVLVFLLFLVGSCRSMFSPLSLCLCATLVAGLSWASLSLCFFLVLLLCIDPCTCAAWCLRCFVTLSSLPRLAWLRCLAQVGLGYGASDDVGDDGYGGGCGLAMPEVSVDDVDDDVYGLRWRLAAMALSSLGRLGCQFVRCCRRPSMMASSSRWRLR